MKVRGFLSGMVEMEMNQAAAGAAGGASGGGLKGLMSRCNIF
jgi:hypothetical protein